LATIQLCFVTVPYLPYIFSVNTAGINKLKIALSYSAILVISALYAVSTYTSSLPPSFLFTYSLSMSALDDALYTLLVIFLVFLSIFFLSSIFQSIIPKLYLNTRPASAPIAVILFLAFSSDFSIILSPLLQSLFHLLLLYAFTFLSP